MTTAIFTTAPAPEGSALIGDTIIHVKRTSADIVCSEPKHLQESLRASGAIRRQIYVAKNLLWTFADVNAGIDEPEMILVKFIEETGSPVMQCQHLTLNLLDKIFAACVRAEESGKLAAGDLELMSRRYFALASAAQTVQMAIEFED